MNNSTNDDLVFQVQLLENTYDRNKVTQTLRKGKSGKDDSFAYTGGKKPKTIFTKTTDKMINEYKEDYEKKQRQGISSNDSLAIDRLKPDLVDTEPYTYNIIQYKQQIKDMGNLLNSEDKKYSANKTLIDNIDNKVTAMRQNPNYNDFNHFTKIQRLLEEKNDKLQETKDISNNMYLLNEDIRDVIASMQREELKLNTTQKENEKKKNTFRDHINNIQMNYIREQTPGETDEEYAQSISQQLQPPSKDSLKEAATYDQMKLLKTNFSKIFDMSNPRRIAIVEDVIQMLQDNYDNGIYDTNTKWPKISTKLLEIYGYDNSNVTKDSLEQILAQYIIASPTVDNVKLTDEWYQDFESKVAAAMPPDINDTESLKSSTKIINRYPDQKIQPQQPADTGDTKSEDSFKSFPAIETTPPPPLSNQTMDLAQEIKETKSAVESKSEPEPEAKTTGRKYEQARLMITEPQFYVLLIRHRGNIFIGISKTGEIGTYTVKPYFAVLKNGMLLPTSEGVKLDKKESVVRPFDQWIGSKALQNPFQYMALKEKYYDMNTGDPKIKNPANVDVLDVEDGEQNILFDYNDEIVRWRSLNPHYTLKGDKDTLGRIDFIKSVSTPRIIGAGKRASTSRIIGSGISIPKHDKIVNFGNVLLMYDRLLRHNMLSIKKKGGGNIENFKNVKVSDKFVDIITGALNKQNINNIYNELSDKEQELYNILVQVSNVHRYANIPKPNIKFLKDRLKIVEGEIEAGNDNLIEELTDILHTMILVKLITKKEATQHLQQYMDMNQ